MENHDQYPRDNESWEEQWKRQQEEEDMRPWKDVRTSVQQQNAIYKKHIKKLKNDLKWTGIIGSVFMYFVAPICLFFALMFHENRMGEDEYDEKISCLEKQYIDENRDYEDTDTSVSSIAVERERSFEKFMEDCDTNIGPWHDW